MCDENEKFGTIVRQDVDCASKTGSQVIGIRIEGPTFFAIDGCAKAQNNVIVGSPTYGILNYGIANSDDFSHNYIEGPGNAGIVLTGNKNATVSDNVIVGSGIGKGIDISASSGVVTISGNVYYNDGPPIDGNGSSTYSRNTCDPQYTDCASCRISGYCVAPVAPFAY